MENQATDKREKRLLPVLCVSSSHGLTGEIKCRLLCDSYDSLKNVTRLYTDDGGSGVLHVVSMRPHGAFLLLRSEEINAPEQVLAYKARELYAEREEIIKPEGSYFIADLVGLPVIDADSGRRYGTLTNVLDNPANQLYEIETPDGVVLFPVIRRFIDKIELGDGIYIRPIAGFFKEE